MICMTIKKIYRCIISVLLIMMLSFSIASGSIFELKATSIDGREVSLSDFKGKVLLVVNTASRCGFTTQYKSNEIIRMPIAHKQGNYFADSELLNELKDNNQIAFQYTDNPNGSCFDIAGIFNKQKNILGMMPHPERAAENILGSKDGIKIFESILSNI